MLGEVVVDAEGVLAVVEEVLAHRAPRVRGHVLDRRRLVGRRGDDDRVLHRAGVLERLHHLHDRGHALPDRDVDADQVGVLVVDDRVDRDRRLAGLAVADDQLALAAADRDHRVDGLQPGLHRLLDRLAVDDARRLPLGGTGLGGVELALVVERAAERVYQSAQQLFPDRDLQQLARPLHRVALDDLLPVAEQHGADVVGLQVQRQADHVVGQLEHLQRHAVVDAVDAGDAVPDLEHGADLGEVRGTRVHALDALSQNAADLVRVDLHVS